ncbi:SMP-30/gluconolactonase/LRE family protein [Plantibacter sp. Mn2098]
MDEVASAGVPETVSGGEGAVEAAPGISVDGAPDVSVEPASAVASQLGESPRWDAERRSLWWVDITGSVLHELRTDGETVSRLLARHAGTVMLADDGRLLLATTAGLEVLDLAAPEIAAAADADAAAVAADGGAHSSAPQVIGGVVVCPIEADEPGRRMNDASVDPSGRVFAGTMRWHDAGAQPHDGVLYRFDGPVPAVPVMTGIGCPNGLVWPRPDLLAYIDSMTRSIALWSVDPETGELLERTGGIDVSAFEGVPDGMTLDADGALWVAFWGGGVVRRFALDGTVLATIELPTPLVTSVAFGGPDLATLYITTARPDPEPVTSASSSASSAPVPASSASSDPAGLLYRCVPGPRGLLPDRWPASR